MRREHFIALADAIREYNQRGSSMVPVDVFTEEQLDCLADFCHEQNPWFKRDLWLSYVSNGNEDRIEICKY